MKPDPYWWEAAPLRTMPRQELPPQVDAAIIGAGYAGLSAAITLARGGRTVLVLDRQRAGEGASTRNGGITSGNIRPSHAQLVRNFGMERAIAIQAEGKAARDDLRRFIEDEGIDCDYHLVGRFNGALSPAEYDAGARDAEQLSRDLGIEAYAVPRAEQHRYIGTDFYAGGSVRMDIGGLHPAKLHAGMLRVALAAGASVQDGTPVRGIAHRGGAFDIVTDRGIVKAGHLIVCTNGYTDGFDPWLRRRIVPIRSRIIATETLPREVMERLMAARMMYSDSRELSYYYRPSPDGSRILFGGRDGTVEGEAAWPTEHLREELARIFPELAGVPLSHSWHGYVAMHRDMVPRLFRQDGRVYATGFCGSGVVWARWLGLKAARQVLGDQAAGTTPFDFRPPKAVPFFRGKAWFMPLLYAKMELTDRRKLQRRPGMADR
ncbi:Glycine/D-amino acid oxidase [Bordetella sputigena]|uniref:NAD(P)/FAD-dependent oxidoreductase n=1 Tax=Bordetella sputigena TaxID=1416810 RepID=UPI0039EEE1DA